MINETSGLSSTILTEQLLRQSGAGQATERESTRPQEQAAPVSDTVNISAEATTLATAVQPVSETSEAQENPQNQVLEEQTTSEDQSSYEPRPGSIDIRV